MNRYMDNSSRIDSDSGIFETFFTDARSYRTSAQKVLDSILSFLFIMRRCLCSQETRRWVRVVSVALCLVGFVGVIGAMERGTLGLGMGLLIGAGLLLVEYLCLKGKPAKKED